MLAFYLVRGTGRCGAKIRAVALLLLIASEGMVESGLPERTVSLTPDHLRELATVYAKRFVCVCAVADQPVWRGDYWEIPVDTIEGRTHSVVSVRIDRRTGEVSYPGQPSVGIADVEQWLRDSKKKQK